MNRILGGLFLSGVAALGLGVGCASTPATAQAPSPSMDTCVSAEGQRFLTYCASPEAAELARRQQVIERSGDEELLPEDMVALTVEGAPLRGTADAGLTIHLYSDLRCAGCQELYVALMERVNASEELRLVFRHVPTDATAEALSLAAIAAEEQGLFWEFADQVVSRGPDVRADQLAELGAEAGLELEQWQRDMGRDRTARALAEDGIRADRVDVVAAPTLFINGRRHVGAISEAELDEHLDAELERVRAMESAGLARRQISWRRVLQNYQPVSWEDVAAADAEVGAALKVAYAPVSVPRTAGASTDEALVTVVLFVDPATDTGPEALTLWLILLEAYGQQGLRLSVRFRPSGPETSESFALARALHAVPGPAEFFTALRDFADRGVLPEGAPDAGAAELDADLVMARELDVARPPVVFVNGIELMGRWSVEELAPLVEDQLSLGETLRELTGQTGEALYRDLVGVNGE